MARRIAIWALVGAAVAFGWYLYFVHLTWGAYHGGPPFPFSSALEMAVNITAPVRPLFGRTYSIKWYWSIVLNAGCYACIGLAMETVWLALRSGFAHARH